MGEIKTAFKQWLTFMGIWIVFGSVTAYLVKFFLPEHEAAGMLNMAMPVLCFFAIELFLKVKIVFAIITYLLTLPLRLFRKKKERDDFGNETLLSNRTLILLCTTFYGLAGLFFRWLYGEEYSVVAYYLAIGFCWGMILYVCLRRGILDLEDMF
ncbi:MAG: hypothetical protein AB8G22_24735 [Saprospiraceae bacterium]